MKTCSHCKIEKSHAEYAKNRASSDGLQTWCRACSNAHNSLPHRKTKKRDWAAANADKVTSSHLKSRYGITLEQYTEMLQAQGGVCAMCFKPERMTANGKPQRLAVDHDHTTGAVRALLCFVCNTVGKPDDIDFLLLRIEYLRRYLPTGLNASASVH